MIPYLDLHHINQSFEPMLSAEVVRVTQSGKYLQGEETVRFEELFAQYCGTSYCVGVANGSDAVALILQAYRELGIMQEGDEVIVPANAYITTIFGILRAGLKPVLCEPLPITQNINPNRIESLINSRTKVILPVHQYGRCADMAPLLKIAGKHHLKVVENATQAPGAHYKGKRAGSLGDAAAFSFYPTENLGALGDAGAITTNDKAMAETIRELANYGATEKSDHPYKGISSRIDEIQAAVLCLKLKRLDEDNKRRQKIARRYVKEIDHPFITLPEIENWNNHVFHVFPIFCQRRDVLHAWMIKNGIQTQIHYPIPPHKQGALKEYSNSFLPITEQIHREELSLPISPLMTNDEVKQVIDAVNRFE